MFAGRIDNIDDDNTFLSRMEPCAPADHLGIQQRRLGRSGKNDPLPVECACEAVRMRNIDTEAQGLSALKMGAEYVHDQRIALNNIYRP